MAYVKIEELADFMDMEVDELPRGGELVLGLVSSIILKRCPKLRGIPEADVSGEVKAVCLQASARVLNTEPGVSSERANEVNMSYVGGIDLTEDELSLLSDYRTPSHGTIRTL